MMSKNKFIYTLVCAALLFQTSFAIAQTLKDPLLFQTDGVNTLFNFEDHVDEVNSALRPIIESVDDYGPAKKAGIIPGDEVLKINNKSINTWGDFTKKVKVSSNQRLLLTIRRNNNNIELIVIPENGFINVTLSVASKENLSTLGYLAEQDNVYAKHLLGFMYINGQGVKQDDKQAFDWFTKAAEQGYADAQHDVGVMYFNGQGVKQDDKQAIKWLFKALDQTQDDAFRSLRYVFSDVKIAQQNYKQAIKWYKFNSEFGDENAQFMLKKLQSEPVEIWLDDLFDNRFDVYNFTHFSNKIRRISQSSEVKEKPSKIFRLHGKRLIKKIWIDIEVQLNKDGTIKRDNNDNIASCIIKAKSDNLLLDEDFVGKNCFIEPKVKDIWDRIKDYAW